MTWSRSSRRPGLLLALVALVLCGCGAGSPPARRPAAAPPGPPAPEPQVSREDAALRVPGQNRLYPSQDPRNRPGSEPLEVAVALASDERQESPPMEEACFLVQILATGSQAKAEETQRRVALDVDRPVLVDREQGLWKLRVGPVPGREEAEGLQRRARDLGFADAFLLECRR